MSANVESMFYVRVAPWHGLGVCVEEALNSREALEKSGLNWMVEQRPIITDGKLIPGYKANIRQTDGSGGLFIGPRASTSAKRLTKLRFLKNSTREWNRFMHLKAG